jgi:hypothetical protein
VIASAAIIEPRPSDSVHLVEEDDTGFLGSGHLEDLADHSGALPDVFLHQLRADDTDEAGLSAVGDGAGCEGLARAWWAVQQHSLGRIDTEIHEFLRIQQRHLHDLPQPLQLILTPTNIIIGHIRLLLDSHHRNRRVNPRRQRQLNLILLAVDSHPHALLHIIIRQLLIEGHHELGHLLDIDDVFDVFLGLLVDDLRASGHLQGVLDGELGVGCQVPLHRQGQSSVQLFYA